MTSLHPNILDLRDQETVHRLIGNDVSVPISHLDWMEERQRRLMENVFAETQSGIAESMFLLSDHTHTLIGVVLGDVQSAVENAEAWLKEQGIEPEAVLLKPWMYSRDPEIQRGFDQAFLPKNQPAA